MMYDSSLSYPQNTLKNLNKYINIIFVLIAKAEKRWWEWQGICYKLQDYIEKSSLFLMNDTLIWNLLRFLLK